jgi:hypothetical protein
MLVGVGHFQEERLLPLKDAGRAMSPARSRVSLWNWHRQGQLNQSGTHIFLRVCKLPSGYHTSLEEIARYLHAVGSVTVPAEVVGGSLHGLTLRVSDTDDLTTAEDFVSQLHGRVVPLDEVYKLIRYCDSRGQPRSFLVYFQDEQKCVEEVERLLRSE